MNQALQYKRVGRWRDYRYGERWYSWLSLVAKSLLAWQVFANVLVLKALDRAPGNALLSTAR